MEMYCEISEKYLRHRRSVKTLLKYYYHYKLSHRLRGKTVLYEYDDPTQKTPLDKNMQPDDMSVHAKIHNKGDVYITIWSDKRDSDKVKWAAAIKGSDVKFVPMMNQLFNRKVTGSQWIKMKDIGNINNLDKNTNFR